MLPRLDSSGEMAGSGTTIVEDPNATYAQILGYDKETANRSTYVSTDVRDAIMLMLPSLIRLFAASENPVFLVPRSQDEVDKAQEATDYVNYVFWCDNPGFLILYGALKDALTVKTGYVKWWCDESKETSGRGSPGSPGTRSSRSFSRTHGEGDSCRPADAERDAAAAVSFTDADGRPGRFRTWRTTPLTGPFWGEPGWTYAGGLTEDGTAADVRRGDRSV